MAERISDDVIAHCHTCGTPCDTHVNCANPVQHPDDSVRCMQGEVGWDVQQACHEFVQLPEEEQKELRKGTKARGGFMTGGKVLPREDRATPRSRQ